MKQYHWTVPDSTGFDHKVSLQTNSWTSKLTITVDGAQSVYKPQITQNLLGLVDYPLTVGDKECHLVVMGNKADLAVDGQFLTGKRPYIPYQKLPKWAWIFLVLCLFNCIGGGALPIVIGLFAAMQCGRAAVSPYISTKSKVLACIGITVASWVALFLISFIFALLLV